MLRDSMHVCQGHLHSWHLSRWCQLDIQGPVADGWGPCGILTEDGNDDGLLRSRSTQVCV